MSDKYLGMGVMINMLGGNEDAVNAINESIGKTIKTAELKDNKIIIHFNDGTGIKIYDDGQSCCENRYMNTDDDFGDIKDAELKEVGVRDTKSQEGEYGETHEVQFLIIKTSKGDITVSTHNEHNGYYGGFWIVCKAISYKGEAKTAKPKEGE